MKVQLLFNKANEWKQLFILRQSLRKLMIYYECKKKLKLRISEYKHKRNTRRLMKAIRCLKVVEETMNSLKLAKAFRSKVLVGKYMRKWLSKIEILKSRRQTHYLLSKSLKGWYNILKEHKDKEEKKCSFYRKLLLKKHMLHRWRYIKNWLQLYKVADRLFILHMLERWRRYRYKRQILKNALSNKISLYKDNRLLTQVSI